MKAKYIGKYCGKGCSRNQVYLEYEYRGMTYTVMEDMGKGNEPLAWQHRAEQDRIDQILDCEGAKGEPFDIDEWWTMIGWD